MTFLEEAQSIINYLNTEEISQIINFLKERNVCIFHENTGMVMLNLEDTFKNPFFMGEILVNESEVEYRGQRGYGMSIGKITEASIIMAALDAGITLDDQEFVEEIKALLKSAEDRMIVNLRLERGLSQSTKVDFGLMVEG